MNSQQSLVEKLSRLVDSAYLLTEPSQLEEHSWDALSEGRIHPLRRPEPANPLCVVLPASTVEVQEVVLLANEEMVPIIPYGGGSGLMGGAISLQPGIVLDLRRMDRVLEIDKEAQTARVQAGIVLEPLEKRLNEKGLFLGHDPWTLPVATVGGAISTNSIGYSGGKYGSMGDQLLGLEVVLPRGEVLRTRSVPKSSTGISLKHLFIGGEGCFGIVTEATLRVFPLPEIFSLQAFRFPSFEVGFRVIKEISARGLKPALMDFGDDSAKAHKGALLYLALAGIREVVEAEEKLALAICDRVGGVSLPRDEAERFWRERHVIAHRFMRNRLQRRKGSSDELRRDWIHVALPTSQVLAFRKLAMELLERQGIDLQESGVWTQPELFSMRLAIEDSERNRLVLEDTVEELLRQVQKMGGSMEYCHGVGLKLAPLMAEEHGQGLEVMRLIKKVLDPKSIMNPAKMGL
ncbi:MAG: FAD-binding oxidoreductase [Candidatus Binatia bacterium]